MSVWRIDAFELWCWRRLLRVPLTARRSNQSILNEINPEYSLEGLMLKLQYFGHLIQRTDAFELWSWKRLLRVPLDCKEIKPVNPKWNQFWIFIGRTDAEAPILWPPDVKADSMEKTPMLGKIEGRRKRGWQRKRWLDGINSMDMCLSKLWKIVKNREVWHTVVHGVTTSWTQLNDWTTKWGCCEN